MKIIKELDRDGILERFDYDKEQGRLFYRKPTPYTPAGREAGRIHEYRGIFNKMISYGGRMYCVHQLIYFLEHGYIPSTIVHIDGDNLNNRISNLKDVPRSHALHASKMHVKNVSGYRNVSPHKQSGKWQVRFKVNGEHVFIGLFEDVHKAGIAAEKARLKYGINARHKDNND